MKGLLLKDLYMIKQYCKSYILIAAIFIAVSLAGNNNMFFVFYPVILCGIIPVNLLGYDERSRFIQYSGTLPYTAAQIVSAKYLIGLFTQLAMLIVTGTVTMIKMDMADSIRINDFIILMLMMLIVSTVTSSFTLPFIFRLGVEKGRIAYYFMICIIFAASFAAGKILGEDLHAEIEINTIMTILCIIGAGIYILSWYLSIVLYKKREL